MLVLTRRPGQTIMIGTDVEVTVLGVVNGTSVRIGIMAPKDVPIDRLEIRERDDYVQRKDL